MSGHQSASSASTRTESETQSVLDYNRILSNDLLNHPDYREWVIQFLLRHPSYNLSPTTGLSAVSPLPSSCGQLSPRLLQATVDREWENYVTHAKQQQQQQQQQQDHGQEQKQAAPITPATLTHRLEASDKMLGEAIVGKDQCLRAAIEYDARLKRIQTQLLIALDEGARDRVQEIKEQVMDLITGYEEIMIRAAEWTREVEDRTKAMIREGFQG